MLIPASMRMFPGRLPHQWGGSRINGVVPASMGRFPHKWGGSRINGVVPASMGWFPHQWGGFRINGMVPASMGWFPHQWGRSCKRAWEDSISKEINLIYFIRWKALLLYNNSTIIMFLLTTRPNRSRALMLGLRLMLLWFMLLIDSIILLLTFHTWLIASTTQTSPRVQAALWHHSSTSPGPSPVVLVCFLHSETQDFVVVSDIIEPALLWSAHWSLPMQSSDSMMFEMRIGDIRTTGPTYESHLERTWVTTSRMIPRSLLMSTFLRRSHRLIPAIRLRTAISKTSNFRPISSVIVQVSALYSRLILIAPALCTIWSWLATPWLWISKLLLGFLPHQLQDRSVSPHLLQSRLLQSSSLPGTQTRWLVSGEHHRSLTSSHVPLEKCTGLLLRSADCQTKSGTFSLCSVNQCL